MHATWTRLSAEEEIFVRPLGVLETVFAYDRVARGIADTETVFIVVVSSTDSETLFSESNVCRAWGALKCLHPLLGAILSERIDGSGFDFVVKRKKVEEVESRELVFVDVPSDEEAALLLSKMLNEEPRLSSDLLAQLWLIRVVNNDQPPRGITWHVVFQLGHCIMDGTAVYNQARIFFDILASEKTPLRYKQALSFEAYLNLHPPIDDLNPHRHGLPRLRWRRAIAKVIYKNRQSRSDGGHSLPQNTFQHSAKTPLVSAALSHTFDQETTTRILKSCRSAGITLGHAMPILCQIAHSRANHGLYSRGVLSRSEWERRIREPMHLGGPINLRPYLDTEWLNAGGNSQGCVAIAHSDITLPAMPIMSESSGGIQAHPPFHKLLSKERFLYRCHFAKRKYDLVLKHPLIVEFAEITRQFSFGRTKAVASRWRALLDPTTSAVLVPIIDRHYVFANAVSTMGNLENILPHVYPLSKDKVSNPVPRLYLKATSSYLRCRPKELYISSVTYDGLLQLQLFTDLSTYDPDLVKEWFNDVGKAMKWYLGGDHDEDAGQHSSRL
ncbi:hypothetical protein M422DRAFT_24154 [Sphaerobolus stellatus SS14]|nr:hypothetical protein M422DRAFT_24154 [Sphaerobolus stellatus SS14]